MIRPDKIQAALIDGVKFRNTDLTGYVLVDIAIQDPVVDPETGEVTQPDPIETVSVPVSTSGLYFQDASELISIKNIKDCQENLDITNAQFNEYLLNMQRSVILDACNKVVNGQADFVGSYNVYPFEKSFDLIGAKIGKFVGVEIEKKSDLMTLVIPTIELCFDADDTFKVYLYNSNKPKTPLQEKEVTTIAGESTIVQLDWVIADDVTHKGGVYYLGYFDADVAANYYRKSYENAIIKLDVPFCYVEPVSLDYEGTRIDVRSEIAETDSFGLNLTINVMKDYTELIVRNKNLFWTAIQMQMHEKVLQLIKYSTRNNRTEVVSSENIDKIDFELYGNAKLGIKGILDKLSDQVASIKKSIFGIPRVVRRTLG